MAQLRKPELPLDPARELHLTRLRRYCLPDLFKPNRTCFADAAGHFPECLPTTETPPPALPGTHFRPAHFGGDPGNRHTITTQQLHLMLLLLLRQRRFSHNKPVLQPPLREMARTIEARLLRPAASLHPIFRELCIPFPPTEGSAISDLTQGTTPLPVLPSLLRLVQTPLDTSTTTAATSAHRPRFDRRRCSYSNMSQTQSPHRASALEAPGERDAASLRSITSSAF